jgi:hypothetical protein
MAILKLLFVSLLPTACYSPELRDCTVTCGSANECAGDQVCTAAGFCAAPDTTCAQLQPPTDAMPDAGVRDAPADAPADAPPAHGLLHVRVMDKGSVNIAGVGTCDEDCMYVVVLDAALDARAVPGKDRVFERWTSETCSGQDETCTLTPSQAITQLSAKFRKPKDD